MCITVDAGWKCNYQQKKNLCSFTPECFSAKEREPRQITEGLMNVWVERGDFLSHLLTYPSTSLTDYKAFFSHAALARCCRLLTLPSFYPTLKFLSISPSPYTHTHTHPPQAALIKADLHVCSRAVWEEMKQKSQLLPLPSVTHLTETPSLRGPRNSQPADTGSP